MSQGTIFKFFKIQITRVIEFGSVLRNERFGARGPEFYFPLPCLHSFKITSAILKFKAKIP